MNDSDAIRFRPLTMDDLPLMLRWLCAPHVRKWWPDGPNTLRGVTAKYAPRIAGELPTRCFVIEYCNRPAGFIQVYRLRDYPEYNRHIQAPDNYAGIDLFIGDPGLVGRSIGTRAVVSFLRSVVFANPSTRACAIGPEQANHRAIRAYEKAGFHYWKTVAVPHERSPEYVMLIQREDLMRR